MGCTLLKRACKFGSSKFKRFEIKNVIGDRVLIGRAVSIKMYGQ